MDDMNRKSETQKGMTRRETKPSVIALITLVSAIAVIGFIMGYAFGNSLDNEARLSPPVITEFSQQESTTNGTVSRISTEYHNPYHNQIRLTIDCGSEFAAFDNCEESEGFYIKVSPGDTVEFPEVRPKPGYYLVGWSQGGVDKNLPWLADDKAMTISDDVTDEKNATVYAVYADDAGNGYCTCGAYEEGIYKDRMAEIKAFSVNRI